MKQSGKGFVFDDVQLLQVGMKNKTKLCVRKMSSDFCIKYIGYLPFVAKQLCRR